MDAYTVVGFLIIALVVIGVPATVIWISWDAGRRGKSKWVVPLMVFFFWPYGLLVWLLIRPDVEPEQPKR